MHFTAPEDTDFAPQELNQIVSCQMLQISPSKQGHRSEIRQHVILEINIFRVSRRNGTPVPRASTHTRLLRWRVCHRQWAVQYTCPQCNVYPLPDLLHAEQNQGIVHVFSFFGTQLEGAPWGSMHALIPFRSALLRLSITRAVAVNPLSSPTPYVNVCTH